MSNIAIKGLDKAVAGDDSLDPISGARGAHPIGTGVGAALGGAATGAVAGSVGGPVGTVVGAVLGDRRGLFGKGVAEAIDSTRELAHAPFGYGFAAYTKYPDRGFDEVDADLSRVWMAWWTLAWDRERLASREVRGRVGSWR